MHSKNVRYSKCTAGSSTVCFVKKKCLHHILFLSQDLEERLKEKEKDLEKAEERGNTLIQDKKGAACSAVKETLEGLNSSRSRLDQMVSFP